MRRRKRDVFFFRSFAKDRFKFELLIFFQFFGERQVTAIFKEHWPTGNQITFHSYENFNFYLVRLGDESRGGLLIERAGSITSFSLED